MSWAPGQPVVTPTDHAQWEAWRRERKRQQQRNRRARHPRIDFYPSAEALRIIDGCRGSVDVSTVLNRIVAECGELVPPE